MLLIKTHPQYVITIMQKQKDLKHQSTYIFFITQIILLIISGFGNSFVEPHMAIEKLSAIHSSGFITYPVFLPTLL